MPLPKLDAKALPKLDISGLKTVFPQSAKAARSRDGSRALPSDRAIRRRLLNRAAVDARKAQNALEVISPLPKSGEQLHVVLSGMSDGWDYIAAVVRLLAPAKVEALTLTSLGFNERVIAGLCKLLDTGDVQTATVVTSVYFQSVDAKLYDQLHAELTRRGQTLAAVRNHAKLALFAVDDGRRYVLTSSANLRTCRSTEVMTVSQDAGLYDFHRAWIETLLAGGDQQ